MPDRAYSYARQHSGGDAAQIEEIGEGGGIAIVGAAAEIAGHQVGGEALYPQGPGLLHRPRPAALVDEHGGDVVVLIGEAGVEGVIGG